MENISCSCKLTGGGADAGVTMSVDLLRARFRGYKAHNVTELPYFSVGHRGLTAAIPLENPWCSCRLTRPSGVMAYSCNPNGESLLQLCAITRVFGRRKVMEFGGGPPPQYAMRCPGPRGAAGRGRRRLAETSRDQMGPIAAQVPPPRPAAAVPMENPYCSCRLTRVAAQGCEGPEPGAELLWARLPVAGGSGAVVQLQLQGEGAGAGAPALCLTAVATTR